MSKERELVEALRDSIDSTPATSGSGADGGAAETAQSAMDFLDFSKVMELFNDIWLSVSGDPIFYFKVMAVLVLTLIILIFAFQMIALE